MLKKKDDRIEELEAMLKANDPSLNMDSVHHLDELNAKDTIISDLKYQLDQVKLGNKDADFDLALLKR